MSVPNGTPSAPAAAAPSAAPSTPAPSGGATGATTTGNSPGSPKPGSKALTSSATTQKIDYGMGPQGESSQPAAVNSDPYGDEFWQQHGDGIFKHPRFKELTGYKKQWDEFTPVKQFVDSIGGFDELQTFHKHFGPVFSHLNSLGPNANNVWNEIYPIFQALLGGQDLKSVYAKLAGAAGNAQPQVDPQVTDDPFLQHLKPVQDELKQTKETLAKMEERDKRKQQEDYKAFQQKNFMSYEKMIQDKFADANDPVPEGYRKFAADLVTQHIATHMPVDQRTGRKINPLDQFSEEAFNAVWNNVVLARIKEIEGVAKSKFIKVNENGGPTLPDTTVHGKTPNANQQANSREEKAQRFAQKFSSMRVS